MDGKEKILDPEDLSLVHQGELSLSSGVISLPSANRLADLSLASDLTDSEVENEPIVQTFSAYGHEHLSNNRQFGKYVKGANRFSMKSSMLTHSQRLSASLQSDSDINDKLNEVPSVITKERARHDSSALNEKSLKKGSNMTVTEDERIIGMPSISLDNVRTALQQNCSLLNDRHLLKDLLKSLDDKIEQDSVSIQPYLPGNKQEINLDSNVEENKHLVFNQLVMSSPKSSSINCVSDGNFDNRNHMVGEVEPLVNSQVEPLHGSRSSETPQENLHVALFSSSLSEQEALPKPADKLTFHSGLGKHVKFQSTTNTTQDPLVETEGKKYGNKLDLGAQQSLNVLKKLAGLRWGLMGWEDVSNSPPTDSSSSLTFLYHLLTSFQALKFEKKHLKEELTTTLKKFKDLSEECNTKQHLYEKRETRLIEADRQLGELQQAWAASHEISQQETAKLKAKCYVLKQENDLLRKEDMCLRNDVMELKSITQQHAVMKAQMLETEEMLAARKKKTTEVLEENNRLNLCLEETKKHIQELEEVKVPQLVDELEDMKVKIGRLEDSNKQLSQAKAQLLEDIHMLQEQHKLLLKKVVDEQENKAVTEQRKEQLKTLESSLQKNFEEQLKAQMENHHIACKKLQERYEEKTRDMKLLYEKQLEKLHCEMRKVEEENHRLQQQKQGVISAVSSILGLEHQTSVNPSNCWNFTVPGSSRQAGGSTSSLDGVKGGSLKDEIHSTSGKNVGNMAGLPFPSSSSSDTESTMFPEGKQTVRHLDGHSLGTLPNDGMSQKGYCKNHSKDFVASPRY
ncbi:uveal autoantigen with coiled-coil domains and ankyrin repeats-like isoform X2 [Portunus trituberculatus]|uniref:uveal autoantigen with coiled-coil domains and ankyrin repeats-like isoform X2 n=1 Tax=Portunus trituberculatus TaxID=210409 RepID=UPI001E1D2155|nr:uveal autoantigen with coiled-coil domains and ankyrin repeats-like isoform X2 [Portunus trituberculatus]